MQGILVRLVPVQVADYALLPDWVTFSSAGLLANGSGATCLSADGWRAAVEGGRTHHAVIETLVDERRIGVVTWRSQRYPRSFEIGGLVGDESLWDAGAGIEAGALLVDYLFRHCDAHRIELLVAAFNERSVGFLARGGMVVEAVLRDYLFSAGEYHDALVCSLLREDYVLPFEAYLPTTELVPEADRDDGPRALRAYLARRPPAWASPAAPRGASPTPAATAAAPLRTDGT